MNSFPSSNHTHTHTQTHTHTHTLQDKLLSLVSHILDVVELLCSSQGQYTGYLYFRDLCGLEEGQKQMLLLNNWVEMDSNHTEAENDAEVDAFLQGNTRGGLICSI